MRCEYPKTKKPLKAIRIMCRECMGGGPVGATVNLIKECASTACPLYEFRLGKNPYHTLNLSPEARQRKSESMKKLVANR